VTLLGLINTLTAVVAYSWYITRQVAVAERERGLMSNLRQLGLRQRRLRQRLVQRRVAVTSLIASERIACCLTAAAPVDGRAANELSSNQGVRPSQVSRSPLDRRTHSFRAQKEPL